MEDIFLKAQFEPLERTISIPETENILGSRLDIPEEGIVNLKTW